MPTSRTHRSYVCYILPTGDLQAAPSTTIYGIFTNTCTDPAQHDRQPTRKKEPRRTGSGPDLPTKGELQKLVVNNKKSFKEGLNKLSFRSIWVGDDKVDLVSFMEHVLLLRAKVRRAMERDRVEQARKATEYAEKAKERQDTQNTNPHGEDEEPQEATPQDTPKAEDTPDGGAGRTSTAIYVTEGDCWQAMFNIVAYIIAHGLKPFYHTVAAISTMSSKSLTAARYSGRDLPSTPAAADITASLEEATHVAAELGGRSDHDNIRQYMQAQIAELEEEIRDLTRLFKVCYEDDVPGPVRKVYKYYTHLQAVRKYIELDDQLREERERSRQHGESLLKRRDQEGNRERDPTVGKRRGPGRPAKKAPAAPEKEDPKGAIELLLLKNGIRGGSGQGQATEILKLIYKQLNGLGPDTEVKKKDTTDLSKRIAKFRPLCALAGELGDGIILLAANKEDLTYGLSRRKARGGSGLYCDEKIKEVAYLLRTVDVEKNKGRLTSMFAKLDEKLLQPLLRLREQQGPNTLAVNCPPLRDVLKKPHSGQLSFILGKINCPKDNSRVSSLRKRGRPRREGSREEARELGGQRGSKRHKPWPSVEDSYTEDESDTGTSSGSDERPRSTSSASSSDTGRTSEPDD